MVKLVWRERQKSEKDEESSMAGGGEELIRLCLEVDLGMESRVSKRWTSLDTAMKLARMKRVL